MIDKTITTGVFGKAVRVSNRAGRGPCVIVCDHASNRIPKAFGSLGLSRADVKRHIAWDPGAAPVARLAAASLDCPLVESTVSRLIVDCNRPLDAPDLISEVSEVTPVPGNTGLAEVERRRRIMGAHLPFHDAVEELVVERIAGGLPATLVAVHTFTPVYKGRARPWHVGVIHDDDRSLADAVIKRLATYGGVVVGDNEPYSPADRVYYTLDRHGSSRGLACVMIEIRNDEVSEERGQELWGLRLSEALGGALGDMDCTDRQRADGHSEKVANA